MSDVGFPLESDSCRTCGVFRDIQGCLGCECDLHRNWIFRYLTGAISDLLDGQGRWYDIQAQTGLSEERCVELANLYATIVTTFPTWNRKL
jgi:hypothetical protein